MGPLTTLPRRDSGANSRKLERDERLVSAFKKYVINSSLTDAFKEVMYIDLDQPPRRQMAFCAFEGRCAAIISTTGRVDGSRKQHSSCDPTLNGRKSRLRSRNQTPASASFFDCKDPIAIVSASYN